MLGNDAMEFLKTLHKLDEIWKQHDDAEYNERQLTQFAERYHEHKLKLFSIADGSGELLKSLHQDLKGFQEMGFLTPDVKAGLGIAMEQVERYMRNDLEAHQQ